MWKQAIIALLASVAAIANAQAADVAIENADYQPKPFQFYFQPTACNVRITGFINGQAVDRFKDLIKERNLPDGKPRTLCLHSPGGDLEAALRLKQVIENNWIPVVEKGKICLSACAILFMGGGKIHKVGDGEKEEYRPERIRYLHFDGRLGFHAPSLVLIDQEQALRSVDVSNAYLRMQLTMRELLFPNIAKRAPTTAAARGADRIGRSMLAGLSRNLDEIYDRHFIPESLLFSFLFTPSSQMRYVETVEDAARWGIELYGYDRRPKDVPEFMLWNACFNMVYRRCGSGEANCRASTFLPIEFASARSTIPLRELYGRRYGRIIPDDKQVPVGLANIAGLRRSWTAVAIGPAGEGCRLYKFDRNGLQAIMGDAASSEDPEADDKDNKWTAEVWKAAEADNWTATALATRMDQGTVAGRVAMLARPWMWLPPETRIADGPLDLDRLMIMAHEEFELEQSGNFRLMRLCNLTPTKVTAAFAFKAEGKAAKHDGWYAINSLACIIRSVRRTDGQAYYFAMQEDGTTFPAQKQMVAGLIVPGCVRFDHRFDFDNDACDKGAEQVYFEPVELTGNITSIVLSPPSGIDGLMERSDLQSAMQNKPGSLLLGDPAFAEPAPTDLVKSWKERKEAAAASRPVVCNSSDRAIYLSIGQFSGMSLVENAVDKALQGKKLDFDDALKLEIAVDGWYKIGLSDCMVLPWSDLIPVMFFRAIDEDGVVLTSEVLTSENSRNFNLLLCLDKDREFVWKNRVELSDNDVKAGAKCGGLGSGAEGSPFEHFRVSANSRIIFPVRVGPLAPGTLPSKDAFNEPKRLPRVALPPPRVNNQR